MERIQLLYDEYSNFKWLKDHESNKAFVKMMYKYLKDKVYLREKISLYEVLKEFGFCEGYYSSSAYHNLGFTIESGIRIKVEKDFIQTNDDCVNMKNTTWMIFDVVAI